MKQDLCTTEPHQHMSGCFAGTQDILMSVQPPIPSLPTCQLRRTPGVAEEVFSKVFHLYEPECKLYIATWYGVSLPVAL